MKYQARDKNLVQCKNVTQNSSQGQAMLVMSKLWMKIQLCSEHT